MTNKQLTVLIGSLAVIAGGAAYWSTLTPAQRCFTEECRWAAHEETYDQKVATLEQNIEASERRQAQAVREIEAIDRAIEDAATR